MFAQHSPPFKGGVAERSTAVEREAGVVIMNREAHVIFVEITNHPVCAFGAATPPLKGGEYRVN
jgi:hypothetical protein